jgi:hypothetical protein
MPDRMTQVNYFISGLLLGIRTENKIEQPIQTTITIKEITVETLI